MPFLGTRDNITPATAGKEFVSILTEFLSSEPEFCNETKNSKYVEHDSSALKKSKLLKNSLRKKAFGKNAKPEDRKAFKQALKAHNYIKRTEDKKKHSKSVHHQEKLYHQNFWKFAGQCAKGTLDQDIVNPTFNVDHANTFYPSTYGSANPVTLDRLKWFPFLSAADTKTPFNMGAVHPRDIKAILKKKIINFCSGPDGVLYGFLKKLPSTHRILATLFSKLLKLGDPPEVWSKSIVSLIYKSGDMDNPSNFRMMSLTSCIGKLFHQIVSSRIESYLLSNHLLDCETQKAFLKGGTFSARQKTVAWSITTNYKI